MESEPASAPASAEPSGLRGLAQAGLLYFEARSRLFQIEAQEAGHHLSRFIALGVIVLGLLGGAWLLLMPVLVWWLAEISGRSWHLVAGLLGAAHLLVAFFLAMKLKVAASQLKLFEETINQCQRDRECLGGNKNEMS